jgi:hypothetical protein
MRPSRVRAGSPGGSPDSGAATDASPTQAPRTSRRVSNGSPLARVSSSPLSVRGRSPLAGEAGPSRVVVGSPDTDGTSSALSIVRSNAHPSNSDLSAALEGLSESPPESTGSRRLPGGFAFERVDSGAAQAMRAGGSEIRPAGRGRGGRASAAGIAVTPQLRLNPLADPALLHPESPRAGEHSEPAPVELAALSLTVGSEPVAAARRSSALRHAVGALDIHSLLTRADDKQFLQEVKPHLQQLRQHLAQIKASMGSNIGSEALPAHLQAALQRRLDNAIKAADSLLIEQPLASRVAKGAAMFAALAPLPLALPFLTQPKQFQYAALTIAHYAKTMVGMAGLMSKPHTDNAQWGRHFNERYMTVIMPAIVSIGPVLTHPEVTNKPEFFAPTGLALLAAGFVSTYPHKVRDLLQQVAKLVRGPQSEGEIDGGVREQIKNLLDELRPTEKAFSEAKENHLGLGGLSVSDSTSAQLSAVTDSVNDLFKTVGALTRNLEAVSIDSSDAQSTLAARPHNPDRNAKIGLALVSAAATFGSAAALLPDVIGAVDFASDAVFVTAMMAALAANPAKTEQDSLATFKSMVGLSLLSIGFLGANKIEPFLGEDMARMAAGTAAIIGANLTLPGPIGNLAGKMTESVMHLGDAAYQQVKQWLGPGDGVASPPDAPSPASSSTVLLDPIPAGAGAADALGPQSAFSAEEPLGIAPSVELTARRQEPAADNPLNRAGN